MIKKRFDVVGSMREGYKKMMCLVGTFLLMTTCAGCGQDAVETIALDDTVPAWQRLAQEKEPVTLDWYINYSWYATPWGGNVVSDTITEETGVSVNFITPIGNATEKLNALMASDTLPDLITLGWWEGAVNEMIQKDMVYALNELADQYDTYFYEVTDEDTVRWYTQDDGNVYCYPNSFTTPRDVEEHDDIASNQTFLVRKDIYEALGEPDMTTQEGFAQAVRDAARLFPEVDGEPLIPIGSQVFTNEGCVSFDAYLMNFLAIPWEKNGKYYDRQTDPEYLSWLNMFRELGTEGYLANDIFVDTRTQMEEKLAQGRYFCMLYQYTDMIDQQKELYANHPERMYMAVDGPANSNGDEPTLPSTGINGWTVTLISKNCKDPERAIAFLDYLISEHGQEITYLGVEGVTYDMVDGKPVLKPEVKEILDNDRVTYDALYGADDAYWMLQDNVMQLQWKQPAGEAVQQIEEWACKHVVYNGQYDCSLLLGSDLYYEDADITDLWSQTLPALLFAPTEEEFYAMVEEYKQERAELGFENVMAEKTKLMQETKEGLGME